MLSYNELKQSALKKYFEKLNDCQREAVFSVNGSVLVLAGAGSGKTTVIINRIANMVLFGNAYFDNSEHECSADDLAFLEDFAAGNSDDVERLKNIVAVSPVKPWNILAVTFTNKAASELKSRLKTMLGKDNASYVHASTFHSACVRILRREIENIGYLSSFTIYDSDDSLRVIKSCISDFGIDEKMFPPKAVLNEISCAKEKVKSPAIYAVNQKMISEKILFQKYTGNIRTDLKPQMLLTLMILSLLLSNFLRIFLIYLKNIRSISNI